MICDLRKRLGQDWVTDSDVEHVYGVLKTNGVGHVTGPGTRAVFLYPHVSLMSHSCVSNTEISSHPDRWGGLHHRVVLQKIFLILGLFSSLLNVKLKKERSLLGGNRDNIGVFCKCKQVDTF